jgi:hypothetical protein
MRLVCFAFTVTVLGSCTSESREFGDNVETSSDATSSSDTTPEGGLSTDDTDTTGSTDTTCSGCFIDGQCVSDGTRNSENECQLCAPQENATDWTSDDGHDCDDGLFCTDGDVCNDGACAGATRDCDDGVACNGVSECDENEDQCIDGENACAEALCDLELDECVTTCSGCTIASQCVPLGQESPDNPCFVCDPDTASDEYSLAVGKECGAEATACSAQDTCNDAGECVPNDFEDGDECDDERYCSTASTCRNGECVATTTLSCDANHSCDDEAAACVCDGCVIDSRCVAAGDTDPNNPCMACAPDVKRDGFSPTEGARCGDEANTCSDQDTCDAAGRCLPNHVDDGTVCTRGECTEGVCIEGQNPFDCIAPNPPETTPPDGVFSQTGTPPAAQGGVILDGRYVPVRVDIYNSDGGAYSLRTFEFRNGFVQVGHQPFLPSGGGVIGQVQFAGTYETSGNQVSFTVERCDPEYNIDVPVLAYTVSANGVTMTESVTESSFVVIAYARE